MNEIDILSSELVENLIKKEQNLLGILKFTQLQTDAIEANDFEKLNNYIEEKQKLIDVIDKLDFQFNEKFKLLKVDLGVNSLDELNGLVGIEPIREVRIKVGRIHMLIEQILSIEKENSVKAKKERDDIKNKIHEISSGKKLVSAYELKPSSSGGAFFDKKK